MLELWADGCSPFLAGFGWGWQTVAAGRHGVAQPLAEHRLCFTAFFFLLWVEENGPASTSIHDASETLAPERTR